MILPLALLAAQGEHSAFVRRSPPHRFISLLKCHPRHVSALTTTYYHEATAEYLYTCRLNVRRGLAENLGTSGESDTISLSLFRTPPRRSVEFGRGNSTTAPPDNSTTFDGADSDSARKAPTQAFTVVRPT